MSTMPVHRFTQEEYLRFEREADRKHDFADGQIVDMAGGSESHALIAGNLMVELGSKLRRRCRVYGSDMRVCVLPRRLLCYPDVTVVCAKPEFLDSHPDTLTNPTLIAEVLSSTERYDRDYKASFFRDAPTVKAYLLVAQQPAAIEYWERHPGGGWVSSQITDPNGSVVVAPLGIELSVAEIYLGVE